MDYFENSVEGESAYFLIKAKPPGRRVKRKQGGAEEQGGYNGGGGCWHNSGNTQRRASHGHVAVS